VDRGTSAVVPDRAGPSAPLAARGPAGHPRAVRRACGPGLLAAGGSLF
jgi:hypothetical protein